MRETRPSGSEGGVALITPSLPLSVAGPRRATRRDNQHIRHILIYSLRPAT